MKFFVKYLISLVFLALIIACNNDEFDSLPVGDEKTFETVMPFQAKVGTLLFNGSINNAILFNGSDLQITSETINGEILNLKLQFNESQNVSSLEEGEYSIISPSSHEVNYLDANNNLFITKLDSLESKGKITITEINRFDNVISGIFEAVMERTNEIGEKEEIEISSGLFNNLTINTSAEVSTSFRAKVDGLNFISSSSSGAVVAIQGENYLLLSGQKNTTNSINIVIPSNIAVGVYDIEQLLSQGASNFEITIDSVTYTGFEGSINITEHDVENKSIKADFNFTARDSDKAEILKQITDGLFEIKYN